MIKAKLLTTLQDTTEKEPPPTPTATSMRASSWRESDRAKANTPTEEEGKTPTSMKDSSSPMKNTESEE